jgi:hypothetical protein
MHSTLSRGCGIASREKGRGRRQMPTIGSQSVALTENRRIALCVVEVRIRHLRWSRQEGTACRNGSMRWATP